MRSPYRDALAHAAGDGDESLEHFVRQQPASRREPYEITLAFQQSEFCELQHGVGESGQRFLAECGCDCPEVHALIQAQAEEEGLFERGVARYGSPRRRLRRKIGLQ